MKENDSRVDYLCWHPEAPNLLLAYYTCSNNGKLILWELDNSMKVFLFVFLINILSFGAIILKVLLIA